MDILALSLPGVDALLNVLTVALGLGLVIFFHELGHFAVAKWCDVNVERFSIGFGPVLWSRKLGETEYALSAIPFGGYVKMLGQDDIDPSQLTSDEIAQDPRSYTAKSVPQRMAIISAGVTMNIITGLLFFVVAFLNGVEADDRVIGSVQVGMPAWEHGIRAGDTLTEINGERIDNYRDIMRSVALSRGEVTVRGVHANGQKYTVTFQPEKDGKQTRRRIGVAPSQSPEVRAMPGTSGRVWVVPGSPAAAAAPPFQPGDRIRRVGADEVHRFSDLADIFDLRSSEPLDLMIERTRPASAPDADPELVSIMVAPQPFRTLGLRMDIGKITDLRRESPAVRAGLQVGDKITQINGEKVGRNLDPFGLTEYFSDRAGEEVTVTVSREVAGREPETKEFRLTPDPRAAWSEPPEYLHSPLSVPSIGIAYHLIPTVYSVDERGPAAGKGISPRESVTEIEFVLAADTPPEIAPPKSVLKIDIATDSDNWAHAFWQLQLLPVESVILTVKAVDSAATRPVELVPVEVDGWYVPGTRGIFFAQQLVPLKAASPGEAIDMGWRYTVNSVKDIYLTLRGLATRDVSPYELSGPIGIVEAAYQVASVGWAHFVLFLGLISINLAVINFLPIPVLDGGHMVFLIWEAVIRRRPNERVVAAATYCGLAFVLGLMFFVIWIDLFVTKN